MWKSSRRKTEGVLVISGPDGTTERETFNCCHCTRIVCISKDDDVNVCSMCFDLTCVECAKSACLPFEKKLEQLERRGQLLRSV